MSRPRNAAQQAAAAAWQRFWDGEGKTAIGLLFQEFGLYASPEGDATQLARAWGQRDVLVRIIQLINLKEERAPHDDRDTSAILERLLRTDINV